MKILMASLIVNDPVKAHAFYTEVLGWKSKMFKPEMALAIVVSPEEPDGTSLLLEPNNHPVSKTFQEAVYKLGLPPIVFGVKDIQADYKRLKEKGVVFRGEPKKTEWGTQVLFEDGFGNLIQLHQLPP